MKFDEPPKLVHKFFSWFCHQIHLEGLEGDLFELFERRLQRRGYIIASLLYILDVLTLIRSSVIRSFFINSKTNQMERFNNYVKIAIRHLWRSKSFSAINLLGLILGITSVIFIGLYVSDELGFDQHLTNSSNKFRVYNERHTDDGNTSYVSIVPPMFAQTLTDNFPQIQKAGRFFLDYEGSVFSFNEKVFSEKNGVYAEQAALEILDIELIDGRLSSLADPKSMFLSESMFHKILGNVKLNNQAIEVNGNIIQIAGVYKDFPKQSHLHPDYIFSFQGLVDRNPNRMRSWTMAQFSTYLALKDGVDLSQFEMLFQDFVTEQSRSFTTRNSYYYIPHFQKITDIHLHSSHFEGEIADVGNYQSILFLSFAAGIILLIAVVNFINLTTAQVVKRAKEVGIRKFVGAGRFQLLAQYTIESCTYSFIAGIVSLAIVIVLLPFFNSFSEKDFLLSDIFQAIQIAIFLGGLLLIGVISGWYPAILITRFQPMTVLRGSGHIQVGTGSSKINVRQLLIGIQYILSIGLILISLVVKEQFQFLQTRDMGFDQGNVMTIQLTPNMMKDLEATKASFSNFNGIDDITFSFGVPGGLVANDGVVIPSVQDQKTSSRMFIVSPNYLNTMGMEIMAGRNFSGELGTDTREAFIINETAVGNFGLGTTQNAIGKAINWQIWGDGSWKKGRIIGVVKDFNFRSLHNPIGSVVMHIDPSNFSTMLIKTNPENLASTLDFIEQEYRKYEPLKPFEFEFVDQTFNVFYKTEQKLGDLFNLLTLLAIFTAGIGLFGLVRYNMINRSKELSIRKVLGATSFKLLDLLVRQYFILAILCLLIAVPVAFYIVNKWLENFAFQVDINFEIFFVVILSTLLLTLGIVGIQVLNVIRTNPVNKLRMD